MASNGRMVAATAFFALLWGACLLDVEGTAPLAVGGNGGTSPSGGSGGTPVPCDVEACPAPSGPCVVAVCRSDGSCGEDNYSAGRPCGEGGETCDGFGACKLPLGAGCQGNDVCLSNFCVANLCCNETCLGECVTCAAPGGEGTCIPRQPASSTCDTDGTCDGLGGCAKGELLRRATYGAGGEERGWDVAVDPANDLVLSGSFEDTFTLAGATLTSTNGHDPFVIKLSSDGQTERWHRVFPTGGSGGQDNYAREVEVDGAGDVFVCGIFENNIGLIANQAVDPGLGARDIFVAKLDGMTGATLWRRVFGTNADDVCYGMALDAAGDVYFGGYNDAEITFGATPLPYGGNDDAYVAKLSGTDGSHLWSRSFGGSNDQRVRDVGWHDGAVFIAGWARDNIDLVASYGGLGNNQNIWVARLDGMGNPQWDRLYTNNQSNGINELALGPTGHVTVSGYFRGTLDFGFGDVTSSSDDAFVLQLDVSTGNPRWVRVFGGSSNQTSFGLDVADDGTVVLSVDFINELVFEQTFNASGVDNALIKLAGDGTTLWARHITGSANEWSEGLLAIGGNDARIVLTGWYTGELTVDGLTVQEQGQEDLFFTIHSP